MAVTNECIDCETSFCALKLPQAEEESIDKMPPERKAAVVKAKKEAPPAKKTKSKKVKETTENSTAGNVKMEPKEARLLQHVNLYNFGENRERIYIGYIMSPIQKGKNGNIMYFIQII